MNQFEEIKSLGRGAYAVVHLVRRKTDKEKFVIKRFHTPMSELTPKERTEVAQVCWQSNCMSYATAAQRARLPVAIARRRVPRAPGRVLTHTAGVRVRVSRRAVPRLHRVCGDFSLCVETTTLLCACCC
jgi:hypothetical protein